MVIQEFHNNINSKLMDQEIKLNTIEEAIEDIKQGKIVIVVDDENRENEGDFIAAAEKVTPELYDPAWARLALCTFVGEAL